MTPGMGTAVVAGHLCLDIIPTLRGGDPAAIFRPGGLTEVGPARLEAGGVVANTGRALHRLGNRARLVGVVGGDAIGSLTMVALEREDPRLAADLRVRPAAQGSYSIVLSPPGGDRSFLHFGGANDTFGADDVADALLADAEVFHFGYPPIMPRLYADGGRALEVLYRRAGRSAVTALDLAMPDPSGPSGRVDWAAVLKRVLPHVQLFLPGADELAAMLAPGRPVPPPAELARAALDLGAAGVVLKLGARGVYARTSAAGLVHAGDEWRSRELWMPAFPVPHVAGTTGAGDAAVAGLLGAVLRSYGPEPALRMMAAVGACSVEGVDAVAGVLPWEATEARIREGWAPGPLASDEPGWKQDAIGCWHGPADA